MKQVKLIFLTALCLFNSLLMAQTATQNVRGLVIDKISQSPIAGAIVQVMHSSPAKGTTTNVEGNFLLSGVVVGVQSFKVTFIGYKEILIQNISVNAGRIGINRAIGRRY